MGGWKDRQIDGRIKRRIKGRRVGWMDG
jgi:hypothetical protein